MSGMAGETKPGMQGAGPEALRRALPGAVQPRITNLARAGIPCRSAPLSFQTGSNFAIHNYTSNFENAVPESLPREISRLEPRKGILAVAPLFAARQGINKLISFAGKSLC